MTVRGLMMTVREGRTMLVGSLTMMMTTTVRDL
jgi:hypothetical protein